MTTKGVTVASSTLAWGPPGSFSSTERQVTTCQEGWQTKENLLDYSEEELGRHNMPSFPLIAWVVAQRTPGPFSALSEVT